jgi:hypothetical protein
MHDGYKKHIQNFWLKVQGRNHLEHVGIAGGMTLKLSSVTSDCMNLIEPTENGVQWQGFVNVLMILWFL